MTNPSGSSSPFRVEALADRLAAVRHRQGRMQGMGFDLRAEAVLETLTEDALKSSEIEG